MVHDNKTVVGRQHTVRLTFPVFVGGAAALQPQDWVLSSGGDASPTKAPMYIEMESVFLASWYYNPFYFLLW